MQLRNIAPQSIDPATVGNDVILTHSNDTQPLNITESEEAEFMLVIVIFFNDSHDWKALVKDVTLFKLGGN